MKIIKKLDWFVLKSYLQLFAGTFVICLFIFFMSTLWRYLNDIVGKGLTWDVLMEFFWYAAMSLVPISLPLAVLLASLISFGNLGEKLELLSMKAAGIPLVRILAPVFFLVLAIGGGSFYFQNVVAPNAVKQMSTLLWSMRMKSPEIDIPEGIFYNQIPGYNLYVEHKDLETGILHGVMIYSNSDNFEDIQIVLADSAKLQNTPDKCHLRLTLYSGERFRNLDPQTGNMMKATMPYMRESFVQEVDNIPFDANFQMMDENSFGGRAQTKPLDKILHDIDSLENVRDSIGKSIFQMEKDYYFAGGIQPGRKDSAQLAERVAQAQAFDSIYAGLSDEQRRDAWTSAVNRLMSVKAEMDFRSFEPMSLNENLRRHHIEAQKKFTLSLACIIFFFIGAPLGAIIRKGGLGIPIVVSVLIFLFYYIINAAGEKMAKTGEWQVWIGIWLSTIILTPISIFLTNRANKDSVVFNIEGYRNFFMIVFGLRFTRKLNRKEVIIHDPDYMKLKVQLIQLSEDCRAYAAKNHLLRMTSYWKIFFHYKNDSAVMDINDRLESIIEELHNSRDNVIIGAINEFPILVPDAHTRPFRNKNWNRAAGIFLPLGIFFWFRIWRFRLRLYRDMQRIQELCPMISERIDLHVLAEEINEAQEGNGA